MDGSSKDKDPCHAKAWLIIKNVNTVYQGLIPAVVLDLDVAQEYKILIFPPGFSIEIFTTLSMK